MVCNPNRKINNDFMSVSSFFSFIWTKHFWEIKIQQYEDNGFNRYPEIEMIDRIQPGIKNQDDVLIRIKTVGR